MRRGFTLVEMLVSTALVMLIMLLFAEIFEQAIGTVRSQRGLIANDERARAFTQALRGDLNDQTYRASVSRGASALNSFSIQESPNGIVSLAAGDRPDPRQRGFTSFSENDPRDDGDDILHMTVAIDETLRNPLVSDPGIAPYQGRAGTPAGATINDLNQPDFDDGRLNGAGGSRAAEITWFLRGTTLYRSVKMLRDPLPSGSPISGAQPASATGAPLMTSYTPFYRDFDYSATNNGQLFFHGLESLDNSQGLANSPLAAPWTRFGHRPLKGQPNDGQPREFDNSGNYFGRFTQEETSHTGFQWPGIDAAAGNNIVDSALVVAPSGIVAVDINTNNTFEPATDVLLQGARAGEDILMTGVETFDIKVWDPGFAEGDENGNSIIDPAEDLNGNGVFDKGLWVDFGNNFQRGLWTAQWTSTSGIPGNLSWGRQNNAYGPGGPTGNHVFDTWHPNLAATLGAPPYHPLQVAAGDTRVVAWAASTAVSQGAVIFPDAAISNFSIGYAAVKTGSNNTGPRVPEWPREPGAMVRDGNVLWQCFDNRIGLEKIRITIRFRDTGSGQARQVTLIHSFVE